MALYEDHQLPTTGATPDQIRDFQIAWLNRRVENLEAIVKELLRNRVNYEGLEAYLGMLRNPGWGPSSMFISGRGEKFVWEMQQGWGPEHLHWPQDTKASDESAD